MRIPREMVEFFVSQASKILPGAEVYLFGSRANDSAKGGDIDIFILAQRRLSLTEQIDFKILFEDNFGEQKLDLLTYPVHSQDPFYLFIKDDAVKLSA